MRPVVQLSHRLTAFGSPLEAASESIPKPSGTQVLLRVLACGVCHSDVHIADGYFDLGGGKRMDLSKGIRLPRTLGHEIAGEVIAVGEAATGVSVGDRRVLYPWIGCGSCSLCMAGDEHLCAQPLHHGTTVDGGFSNLVMAPHPRYLLDFAPLDPAYAATLACSGLTAYSALRKAGPLSSNDWLLVIGAGGVGLSALAICRAAHGAYVVAADIDAGKRQGALAAGAEEAVDPGDVEARRRLLKQSSGGFNAVVDFVGAQSTAEFGLSVLRKGGKHISVGLFGGALELPLPSLPLRAITIAGSYVGRLEEMQALMALARDGKLVPMQVETRPLGSVQSVLDDLRAGRIRSRAAVVPPNAADA